MVWLSDSDFLTNGGGFTSSPAYSQSFVYPANVQFMLNSVSWLLETDVVAPSFPTPAATGTATITPSPTPSPTPKPTPTATVSS